MIIVTGTGRSGTSFFSNVLHRAGVDTGATLDPTFREHAEAVAIDAAIIRERGWATWVRTEEMAERFGPRMRAISAQVIKSTASGHTLDVWWTARSEDLSVVLCHRRIDKSVSSFLKAYPNGQLALTAVGYPASVGEVDKRAWLPMVLGQLMDVLMSCYIPYRVFRFPDDLAAPELAWHRLAPVLGAVVAREAFLDAVEATADRSKIHW
jgi:hypothetical protein